MISFFRYFFVPLIVAGSFFTIGNAYFIGLNRILNGSYDWLHVLAASLGNTVPAAVLALIIAGIAKAIWRSVHFMGRWRKIFIVASIIFGLFHFYVRSYEASIAQGSKDEDVLSQVFI